MCSQSTSQRECAFVGHAGCCWSVLYIDCCTWAVIRLSAKQRRRQTRLIMAVFISTYVTTVTFFIHICGFIGEDNHSSADICILSVLLKAADSHCRHYIKRLINYPHASSVSHVDNEVSLLCFKTKPIKCVWVASSFNWITCVDLELTELLACASNSMRGKRGIT